jgi:cyclase
MKRFRVIPILLIKDGGLYKGEKFKNHKYVGDPINAVKIFNEMEVDEISILDISATTGNKEPDFELIEEIASEAFMPLSYGGGLKTIKQVEKVLKSGLEKVIFNYSAAHHPELIRETAAKFGSSSTVVSMDVRSGGFFGQKRVVVLNGTTNLDVPPLEFAKKMEDLGVGELILTSVDQEGTMKGYDLKLIDGIAHQISIPLIANGGAGNTEDFRSAIQAGASAVAAGSFFVFQGPRKAVLISYPSQEELYK